MTGKYKLFLGDCLDIMPTLEAESIDLVLTDPPYPELKGGTKFFTNGGVAQSVNDSVSIGDIWGANLDWIDDGWRIAKLGMMVFCSFHSVDTVKQRLREYAIGLVTWHKRNSPNPVNNVPKYTDEYIWLFKKAPGLFWRNLQTHYDIPALQAGCMATERILNPDGSTAHPTQKPKSLICQLLRCNPASVFDPFMGSGTTGVACVQLNRNFIGIEKEPKYFKIAKKRIETAASQGTIFDILEETKKPETKQLSIFDET